MKEPFNPVHVCVFLAAKKKRGLDTEWRYSGPGYVERFESDAVILDVTPHLVALRTAETLNSLSVGELLRIGNHKYFIASINLSDNVVKVMSKRSRLKPHSLRRVTSEAYTVPSDVMADMHRIERGEKPLDAKRWVKRAVAR